MSGHSLRENEIEVRMPVSSAPIWIMRTLAGDMALREDFDLDAVADLRLAVDEACGTVLVRAAPEGTLTCRLLVAPERVEVNTTAAAPAGYPPEVDSLGWHMLQMLADSVRCWISEADGTRLIHVRLTKEKPTYGLPDLR